MRGKKMRGKKVKEIKRFMRRFFGNWDFRKRAYHKRVSKQRFETVGRYERLVERKFTVFADAGRQFYQRLKRRVRGRRVEELR